ncbi:hypothetical protein Tco_0153893 [Tanacetum coccineum]
MVAYLKKPEGNGKVKIVTEASVRRHLQLADSNGISSLPTTQIFEQLSLMGYVSTSDKLTFQKGHFSPQWRFLIHTILHCLSPKKTSWEQFSSNIETAIICLATDRKFNFSKLIFDGMVKNVDSKHKILMYPRFIQVFLNKQKRQKIGESSDPAEEPKDKEEELSQEELQQMMIIVPEQGMNVEEKGIDICMLVEKEYPLSRGTLTQMLVAKLLVDQDNKMSREVLRRYSCRLKDQKDEVFGRILTENKILIQET